MKNTLGSLRTAEMNAHYEAAKSNLSPDYCPMCQNPSIEEFEHWRVIENDFPYDNIASVHHMIVPKRHIDESALTTEELIEFQMLKRADLNDRYDMLLEPFHKRKSQPQHFHYHLIVEKNTD